MKIGDKVEVIDPCYGYKMGEILTIRKVRKALGKQYFLDFEGEIFTLLDKRVKLIKTNMKKSDLKDGMTVKTRKGFLYEVSGDSLKELSCNIIPLSEYNEKLKHESETIYDIVEVYETIWQREEPTELTMQEIADKFNIEVTNLKIKK